MKIVPVLFAVAALFFYTVFNVVLSRKVMHVSPSVLVPSYTVFLLLGGALIHVLAQGKTSVVPHGFDWVWMIILGLCILFADLCYVNALAQGGSVALVTTVICMLPVAIVIANWMIEGSTPNKAQVAAIVLAITSVVIIATDMK